MFQPVITAHNDNQGKQPPMAQITALLLDIEGTVCPITFVKDCLFPYFLKKLPDVLSLVEFPLESSSQDSPIVSVIEGFPPETRTTREALQDHIVQLVKNDVKEKNLKALQGLVWNEGYSSGEIKAPLYQDAIDLIQVQSRNHKVYIYSSGSVHAQKLLFGHVDINGKSTDINGYLSGYFDITTSGYKFEPQSYKNIIQNIGIPGQEVLFLSDNVKEVQAALEAGLKAHVVVRPGNSPLTQDEVEKYKAVDDFSHLQL